MRPVGRYAAVAIESPLSTLYHYRIPPEMQSRLAPGSWVRVPFGKRRIRGFCVEILETSPVEEDRLKEILEVGPEEERVTAEILSLTRWIASYYHTGWGTVLAAAVPAGVRNSKALPTQVFVHLAMPKTEAEALLPTLQKRAPKQAVALATLLAQPEEAPILALELEQKASVTRAALRGLERLGVLRLTPQPVAREIAGLPERERSISLTEEQKTAITAIRAALDHRTFHPFLLYGVTGSGKTEVYLQALTHVLAQGRTALVLVPEISLTPQTVERFRRRVGEVAVLHSNMSEGERATAWRRLRSGELRVAVGARSAIFAPLPDLGLIIIDEEHERTFKQENDPRYHARDVAVVRARENKAVILLGSATPSLESWRNAQEGKYTLLTLPHRVGGAKPPRITLVDMRAEQADVKYAAILSRPLERALAVCLSRHEQAIILLNRRGFHTYVYCIVCGEPLRCPSCAIALTHHRGENRLRCHYCDFSQETPKRCSACSSSALRYGGVGTERVEDVLQKRFPEARILRMDSDTMQTRNAHAEALLRFARGECDILLGTQMVAKGFDFPNVTVVGVLAADAALCLPDFRSSERTFQLITQVVGRAGRGEKPGEAIIQAFLPHHPSVRFATQQDFRAFAEQEYRDRQLFGYPPFGRLVRIIARGKNPKAVEKVIREAADAIRLAMTSQGTKGGESNVTLPASDKGEEGAKAVTSQRCSLLGPAPCPIPRLHDETRWHLLLKGRTSRDLSKILPALDPFLPSKRNVRFAVDVDPISML